MHVFNSLAPRLEFASLTLLYNLDSTLIGNPSTKDTQTSYAQNNDGGGDDNDNAANNCEKPMHQTSPADASAIETMCDTFYEISSVSSPLSSVSPSVISSAMHELHGSLSGPNTRSRGIKCNDRLGKEKNNTTYNTKNDENELESGKDKNEEEQTENVNSKESTASVEGSSFSTGRVNDNELIQNKISEDYNVDTSLNDQSLSLFQSLCMKEEQSFYTLQQKNEPNSKSKTTIQTGSRNIHGCTIHFKIITNQQIIQYCLSFLNPHMKESALKALYNENMAAVLCVGVSGMTQLYHSHPHVYNISSKMNDFEPSLLSSLSIPKSSIKKDTNISEKKEEERFEIEVLLMSILLDDESIKTNNDVEIEKGNLYSIHQQLQSPMMHYSNSIHPTSKLHKSTSKFKLKKSFKRRTQKMKKFFGADSSKNKNDDNDDDFSDFAATAFLSQSTPPSEITRIVSDQMQVLSLVEKGMNLTSYKLTNDGLMNGSSSARTTKNYSHGVKSPANSKRRGRKYIGSDLSGFDYNDKKNSSIYDRIDNQSASLSSKESTMTGGGSVASLGSKGVAGHYRGSSVGSEITSTTATTMSSSSIPIPSDTSSVTSSSVSTMSSASFIPTLSGPIRDSSLSKKKVRRDKVRKAIEANSQSRSINYAISMENGLMGQSAQPNKVQGAVNGHSRQLNGMSSGFDPFAIDEENEDLHMNSNGSSGQMVMMEQRHEYSNYNFDAIPSTSESALSPKNISRPTYVPGSRKLFANIALNEDLSCLYRESKLSSYSVEGNVQILLKSDSTAFVPFQVVLTDAHDYIETLNENSKYSNIVSKEEHFEEDLVGTKFKFMVTLPKYDHFFEILKYKCKSTLIPVPLRVQVRVKLNDTTCLVALQISSNPCNDKNLSDFTIFMVVPPNVIGESVTTQPVGGVYDEEKNSVIWCVSQLGKGEKFQLHAKFKMENSVSNDDEKPSFPILVRCQSLYTHLSGVSVDCEDEPNSFPADVKTKVARRFRVAHKER